MQENYFPVPLDKMGAKFSFWQPDFNKYTGPTGNQWEVLKHNHPGNAYSYRLTSNSKTVVYCTDIEHGDEIDQRIVEVSRDADLLIHDAQYTPREQLQKKGWGHSTWEQAVEVAKRAKVKKLALFHHDPEHNDDFLREIESKCQNEFTHAFFAREGQEVILYGRLNMEGASKSLMAEVQYMFADWYYLHIKEWDKPFADFLKSKNVSSLASLA